MSLPDRWTTGLLGGLTAIADLQREHGCSWEAADKMWRDLVRHDSLERAEAEGMRYAAEGNVLHIIRPKDLQ